MPSTMNTDELEILELSRLKTFLARAHTAPLEYALRAPPVPLPDQYAHPWPTPVELVLPSEPRTLIQIFRFIDLGQRLELNTQKFFNRISESTLIDWEGPECENLKLPAPGITVMTQITKDRLKVEDINSFTLAVYTSIIVTAMECIRIVQGKLYPKSSRFTRKFEIRPARGAPWDILLLFNPIPHMAKEPERYELAVICLPPWSFSKLDMEEFATSGIFHANDLDFPPNSMRASNSMLLWAVVHDVCKNAKCRYFIVTTYDHWVFGNISERRTTAAVSPVYDFSAHTEGLRMPNLLQLVTYWGLLSLGTETGWNLPTETPGFIRPH